MEEYSDKIPRVISQARKDTTPFKAFYYLITDDIFDNIVQHRNKCILISPLSAAKVIPDSQTKLR
jgi:hypothetical protein